MQHTFYTAFDAETLDGRRKPDIVAPGTRIESVSPLSDACAPPIFPLVLAVAF